MDFSSLAKEVLDTLPIAISMQTPTREVLYENRAMKQLFGDQDRTFCFERFGYLNQDDACIDCPAYISLHDKRSHSVLRRMTTPAGKNIYLKIQHFPVLDESNEVVRYIECMIDVTDEKKEIIRDAEILMQFSKKLHLAFIRVGGLGSEPVAYLELPFVDKNTPEHFLIQFGAFWMAALGQGENLPEGFFGPLPVLDYHRYISYAYSKIMKSNNSDYRYKGSEFTILLLITDFTSEGLFVRRRWISEIIEEILGNVDHAENVTELHLELIKRKIISHLEVQNLPKEFFDAIDLPPRMVRLL